MGARRERLIVGCGLQITLKLLYHLSMDDKCKSMFT
jgi:hypothetical protein